MKVYVLPDMVEKELLYVDVESGLEATDELLCGVVDNVDGKPTITEEEYSRVLAYITRRQALDYWYFYILMTTPYRKRARLSSVVDTIHAINDDDEDFFVMYEEFLRKCTVGNLKIKRPRINHDAAVVTEHVSKHYKYAVTNPDKRKQFVSELNDALEYMGE